MQNNKIQPTKIGVSPILEALSRLLTQEFDNQDLKYILLPLLVIRRMDGMLSAVNEKVWGIQKAYANLLAEDKLDLKIKEATHGLAYYNTSGLTLDDLRKKPETIDTQIYHYLDGFNPEFKVYLDQLLFYKKVGRMIHKNLLYSALDVLCSFNLSAQAIDEHQIVAFCEELVSYSIQWETYGSAATPLDVVQLMNALVFAEEESTPAPAPEPVQEPVQAQERTIFDPASGSGRLLHYAKHYLLHEKPERSADKIMLYGQELDQKACALSQCLALISGEPMEVHAGDSLSEDHYAHKTFHYILSHLPWGVSWSSNETYFKRETLRPNGRFSAGLPSKNDSQLLFIEHAISKMQAHDGRIGLITTGAPLMSGHAGSGESAIRQWIIENDLLECLVALPKGLFYNTAETTYLWILTNHKSVQRKGKIQLINALDFSEAMASPEQEKHTFMPTAALEKIKTLHRQFAEEEYSKVYENKFFGYYHLRLNQPMRNEKNEIVLYNGTPMADGSKRVDEEIPLLDDVEAYLHSNIYPYIDKGAWIDLEHVNVGYRIDFFQVFSKKEMVQYSADLKKEILMMERSIASKMNDLFDFDLFN